MSDADVLHLALRQLLDHDQTPPCALSDLWLSDDDEDREAAGYRCQPCTLLAPCHDFASTALPRITFGIFGGVDFTATAKPAPSLRQVTPSSGDVSNTARPNPKATP